MTTGPTAVNADSTGGHSGHWGLAALLLGSLLLILFPIALATMLGLLIGAWNINEVELRHVQFAVLGGRVIVYGLLGLGVLALASGILGLARAGGRRQPFGLPIVGTATALVALAAAVVLVVAAEYVAEDTRRLRLEHPRFRPADAALIKEVKEAVEENPELKPDWDKAMKDGVLTEAEAWKILVKAGKRVPAPR
jgi:hypothetical protein